MCSPAKIGSRSCAAPPATGPVTDPTERDASLAVVEVGHGRVACRFDRNTFFNVNGGGSSLPPADNQRYARNLFAYLAGR